MLRKQLKERLKNLRTLGKTVLLLVLHQVAPLHHESTALLNQISSKGANLDWGIRLNTHYYFISQAALYEHGHVM